MRPSAVMTFMLLRRENQPIVATIAVLALAAVGLWWFRHGGATGELVDYDELPAREAALVVDVNTAGAAELAQLPGVGPTLALRIVEHRAAHGPFRTVEQLNDVKGIGEKTFAALRKHVTLGGTPPP